MCLNPGLSTVLSGTPSFPTWYAMAEVSSLCCGLSLENLVPLATLLSIVCCVTLESRFFDAVEVKPAKRGKPEMRIHADGCGSTRNARRSMIKYGTTRKLYGSVCKKDDIYALGATFYQLYLSL